MSNWIRDLRNKFYWSNPPVTFKGLGIFPTAISRRTAFQMREHIIKASQSPYVRYWAEIIVENVPDRARRQEILTIFNFVQDATRYANDPKGLEYIQTPRHILERVERGEKPSLDCDDYTVLSLALLRCLGYKTRIVVVGFAKDKPYSHVFGKVELDGSWIPFDAVRKDKTLGWESPRIVKKFEFKV